MGLFGQHVGYEDLQKEFLKKTTDAWEEYAHLHDLPIASLHHIGLTQPVTWLKCLEIGLW